MKGGATTDLRKRLHVSNGLTLVLLSIGVSYTVIWWSLGQPELSAVTAIGAFVWLGSWIALTRGLHLVGRAGAIGGGLLLIFAYGELFDARSNMSIYLPNAATLPAVMFTARERAIRWSLTLAGFFLWAITESRVLGVGHV